MEKLDELLTIEQTAEYLQLCPTTIRGYIKAGALPSIKVGPRIRIKAVDIAEFLDRRRRSGKTRPTGTPRTTDEENSDELDWEEIPTESTTVDTPKEATGMPRTIDKKNSDELDWEEVLAELTAVNALKEATGTPRTTDKKNSDKLDGKEIPAELTAVNVLKEAITDIENATTLTQLDDKKQG